MEVKQRRIAIIDSRQERHELLQKRLGPSFDYDDYTKGGDAFGQLCHDNADIDMVFVGDDLMDTDAMGMLFMIRKQGFDNIDAVLILDDATSALDLETEAALYNALRKQMHEMTTLVITQRIATARRCDRIVVLDHGCLVGVGRHEDLLAGCPVYADICSSQRMKGDARNG